MEGLSHKLSLPVLVLLLVISKIGGMMHAFEHNPLSEEEHHCLVCIPAQSLEHGTVDASTDYPAANYSHTELSQLLHVIPLAFVYRNNSRAPPLKTPS